MSTENTNPATNAPETGAETAVAAESTTTTPPEGSATTEGGGNEAPGLLDKIKELVGWKDGKAEQPAAAATEEPAAAAAAGQAADGPNNDAPLTQKDVEAAIARALEKQASAAEAEKTQEQLVAGTRTAFKAAGLPEELADLLDYSDPQQLPGKVEQLIKLTSTGITQGVQKRLAGTTPEGLGKGVNEDAAIEEAIRKGIRGQ